MDAFTRRKLLATAGVAGVGLVAGCLGGDGDDGDEDDEGPEGSALGQAIVRNLDDEPHEVDLIVEYDGEFEHWTTHDLEARGGADQEAIDGEWPSGPGDYRVTVRLDGSERANQRPADWNDPACLDLLIEVDGDGQLNMWGQIDGEGCGSGPTSGSGDEE